MFFEYHHFIPVPSPFPWGYRPRSSIFPEELNNLLFPSLARRPFQTHLKHISFKDLFLIKAFYFPQGSPSGRESADSVARSPVPEVTDQLYESKLEKTFPLFLPRGCYLNRLISDGFCKCAAWCCHRLLQWRAKGLHIFSNYFVAHWGRRVNFGTGRLRTFSGTTWVCAEKLGEILDGRTERAHLGFLGLFWSFLGLFRPILELFSHTLAYFGAFGAVLGAVLAYFGVFGPILEHFGPVFRLIGLFLGILGLFWHFLGQFWPILSVFGLFWRFLGHFRPILVHFRPMLGH